MTADELRAQYNTAYKILARERRWREHIFALGHPQREEKLREMDRVLEILTTLKDELKQRLAASYEQPTLLDVPPKTHYR